MRGRVKASTLCVQSLPPNAFKTYNYSHPQQQLELQFTASKILTYLDPLFTFIWLFGGFKPLVNL